MRAQVSRRPTSACRGWGQQAEPAIWGSRRVGRPPGRQVAQPDYLPPGAGHLYHRRLHLTGGRCGHQRLSTDTENVVARMERSALPPRGTVNRAYGTMLGGCRSPPRYFSQGVCKVYFLVFSACLLKHCVRAGCLTAIPETIDTRGRHAAITGKVSGRAGGCRRTATCIGHRPCGLAHSRRLADRV